MKTTDVDARRDGARLVPLGASGDARVVGGKAAPLARVAAAGHRVPPGWVVVAGAAQGGVAPLREELARRLEELGGERFAVRSSAVREDSRARSFAGQLETLLDVPAGDVAGAIERCWASASALRVLRYAPGGARPGASSAPSGEVAVLVQPMLRPRAAGVAFSADPATGARGVVVVEAVPGVAAALVSGEADPEAWRVEGEPRRTRTAPRPVLRPEDAARVAALARDLEALLGGPQDVEWALEGDELFVLQARPITALPAAPVPIPVEPPPGDWDRDDHHGVLSPLGWHWLAPYPKAMAAGMRELGMPVKDILTARIGGQLYLQMQMPGGGAKAPPSWVLWLATRLVPSMRRANRTCAALLDGETFVADVERWEAEQRPALRREIDALFVEDPSGLGDDELLARIQASLDLTRRGLELHARLGAPPILGVGKLALFLEDELGWSPDRAWELVAGSSGSTTELHRRLERLVAEHEAELPSDPPRTWGELADRCPRLEAALADWLAENRLRMLHYDPRHPTLGERPEVVLAILDGILSSRGGAAPVVGGAPVALEEARAALDEARFAELERLLAVARRCHALRDDNGVEAVSRPTGLLRHFVLELGRRLEGELGDAAHAVYLEPSEHGPALRRELPDLRARVERRRGEESWALANRGARRHGKPKPPMPPLSAFPSGLGRVMRIFSWVERGEATPDEAPEGEPLRGFGVGGRAVTARARVIQRPEQLVGLRHGEIVVCRITSPEWSVSLGKVAALVTDEGGVLSHPAIIAREYGVPAVVGAAGATRRVATGDTIRVDPAAGTVTIVRPAGA